MASSYYNSVGKSVTDGNTALASDLNSINTAIDTAFQLVETAILAISSSASYYSDLAQKYANNPEDSQVTTGKYSALHFSNKAATSATAAASSASSALSYSSAASSSASSASASSINSASSATAASGSATAASNSATAASGSATAAHNSEVKAAASVASLPTFPTLGSGDQGKFLKVATPYTNGYITSTVDLSTKADINSPTFTGTPIAPTATPGTNTTQICTTAFTSAAIAAIPVVSPTQVFWVQDEKTQGTSGGSSVSGTQVRTLNTVKLNEITGASLSSNQITIPAGSYEVIANPGNYVGATGARKLRLYNVTDASYLIEGTNSQHYTNSSRIHGFFTITGTKVIELREFIVSAVTDGLGAAISHGTEIYSSVILKKRVY